MKIFDGKKIEKTDEGGLFLLVLEQHNRCVDDHKVKRFITPHVCNAVYLPK